MKFQIKLADEAIESIKKASNYYLDISSSLNDKFIIDIEESIDRLRFNPQHYQLRYRNVRIAHMEVFPFGIHFIIENSTISILNILHHKQFYK